MVGRVLRLGLDCHNMYAKARGSENEFLWVLWMLFGYLSIYAAR